MTQTSLVTGGQTIHREAIIFNRIVPALQTAIILEGLPTGSSKLDTLASSPDLKIARIAPGCLCCTGNLIMRVTLNRLLRSRPAHLYISVANDEHIEQLRRFLTQAPYNALLTLNDDIICSDATT